MSPRIGEPFSYGLTWREELGLDPINKPEARAAQETAARAQRIEDYRSGYSAGWADGRNGEPMQDAAKSALFFGRQCVCCNEPAPDRSGRSCDKPKGHEGEHWTYGGNALTWPSAPSPESAG